MHTHWTFRSTRRVITPLLVCRVSKVRSFKLRRAAKRHVALRNYLLIPSHSLLLPSLWEAGSPGLFARLDQLFPRQKNLRLSCFSLKRWLADFIREREPIAAQQLHPKIEFFIFDHLFICLADHSRYISYKQTKCINCRWKRCAMFPSLSN